MMWLGIGTTAVRNPKPCTGLCTLLYFFVVITGGRDLGELEGGGVIGRARTGQYLAPSDPLQYLLFKYIRTKWES